MRPQSQFSRSCVRAISIFPGSVHIFSCSRICRPIVRTHKSLTDTWMWTLGLWPWNSFSGNICFEFSVLCLCNAAHIMFSSRRKLFKLPIRKLIIILIRKLFKILISPCSASVSQKLLIVHIRKLFKIHISPCSLCQTETIYNIYQPLFCLCQTEAIYNTNQPLFCHCQDRNYLWYLSAIVLFVRQKLFLIPISSCSSSVRTKTIYDTYQTFFWVSLSGRNYL